MELPAFDFRTARHAFDAWDRRYTVHRDAKEFLDLYSVSKQGLTGRVAEVAALGGYWTTATVQITAL